MPDTPTVLTADQVAVNDRINYELKYLAERLMIASHTSVLLSILTPSIIHHANGVSSSPGQLTVYFSGESRRSAFVEKLESSWKDDDEESPGKAFSRIGVALNLLIVES